MSKPGEAHAAYEMSCEMDGLRARLAWAALVARLPSTVDLASISFEHVQRHVGYDNHRVLSELKVMACTLGFSVIQVSCFRGFGNVTAGL